MYSLTSQFCPSGRLCRAVRTMRIQEDDNTEIDLANCVSKLYGVGQETGCVEEAKEMLEVMKKKNCDKKATLRVMTCVALIRRDEYQLALLAEAQDYTDEFGAHDELALSENEKRLNRKMPNQGFDPYRDLDHIRKESEFGDPWAIFLLGLHHREGSGVEKSKEKAIDLYLRASQRGCAAATFELGSLYMNGDGVKQDRKKAIEMWEKAAEAKHGAAMSNLGFCYDNGIGVERDPKKAVELYESASQYFNANGMYNLGLCYMNGSNGVKQNDEKAFDLWYSAAHFDHENAAYNLGICYYHGIGIKQSEEKAMFWLKRAEELGSSLAKSFLQRLTE